MSEVRDNGSAGLLNMDSEICDLLVVADATGSMGKYLASLNESLPEIIRISALTGRFERIGVVAYRDWCDINVLEWSGWCSAVEESSQQSDNTIDNDKAEQMLSSWGLPKRNRFATTSRDDDKDRVATQSELLDMVRNLKPIGGGDWPEATKSGLAKAYSVMRPGVTTAILLYADAPPHLPETGGENRKVERKKLEDSQAFGGRGKDFLDWAVASRTMAGVDGDAAKKAVVFSLVGNSSIPAYSPYMFLSTVSGGACFTLNANASVISRLTIAILLTWMNVSKDGVEASRAQLALSVKYKPAELPTFMKDVKSETTLAAKLVCSNFYSHSPDAGVIESTPINLANLAEEMTARGPPVQNFAARYTSDPAYRATVISQLRTIIKEDVTSMTVNPVFGTLWRAVCFDRTNERREELLAEFSRSVDLISDLNKRDEIKKWLAESYDYRGEIDAMISEVKEEERFPCVYFDPTENFSGGDGKGFTRDELLEIGRSCDPRILRRIGKVLTRLVYAERRSDLPAHIVNADAKDAPVMLPLSLASSEHNRMFWRVLLHLVFPGTMVSARPAAILSALALRMGIPFLREVADKQLLCFRDNWNNIEVPETWSVGCLGLLLEADADYRRRLMIDEVLDTKNSDDGLLRKGDREIFATLVDYKVLETNLDTTLTATLGWTPEKTLAPIGPVVICRGCNFPRSVTMMSKDRLCGHCATKKATCSCDACTPGEDYDERLRCNVSKKDSEGTGRTWVECCIRKCRAQYVVSNPRKLNVRAKCFYCRHGNTAPWVECRTCLNRMVYPVEYRPSDFNAEDWTCPPCAVNKGTLSSDVKVKTLSACDATARGLSTENGTDWLVRNSNALETLFGGVSVFRIASTCTDLQTLPENLTVFPSSTSKLALTLHGKVVHNPKEILDGLRTWVSSRRAEAGTCSLCFDDKRKTLLLRACGRSGCLQKICTTCRATWYGINSPGKILNIAALSCPFCRRKPVASAVHAFGLDRLGGLAEAVRDTSWVYAWCRDCGFACQFAERVCAAAGGAGRYVEDFVCEACETAREEEKTVKKRVMRECPKCGVMTEKLWGCDHISCPCGAHWCYACGEEADEGSIYTHMEENHGGLWGEDEDDEEWDD